MDILDSLDAFVDGEYGGIMMFLMEFFHLRDYLICHRLECRDFFLELRRRGDMIKISLSS